MIQNTYAQEERLYYQIRQLLPTVIISKLAYFFNLQRSSENVSCFPSLHELFVAFLEMIIFPLIYSIYSER